MKKQILLFLFTAVFAFPLSSQTDGPARTELSAAEIANLNLGGNVYSFVVSYRAGAAFVERKCRGNSLPPDMKTVIYSLEPGTLVCFEQIKASDEAGNELRLPSRLYVIRR